MTLFEQQLNCSDMLYDFFDNRVFSLRNHESSLKIYDSLTNVDVCICRTVLCSVKFIYSEKATKFCEISILLLSNVVPLKSKVKIAQTYILRRPQKFSEIFTLLLSYVVPVKSKVKIAQTYSLRRPKNFAKSLPYFCPM